jgi:hypothetical protein
MGKGASLHVLSTTPILLLAQDVGKLFLIQALNDTTSHLLPVWK